MNEKVLRVCEFNTITTLLEAEATSDPGRALCRALVPMHDMVDIVKAQNETAAAVSFLFRSGSISFGNTLDFSDAFGAMHIGQSLSIPELLQFSSFLENVAQVKRRAPEDENDALFDLFDCLVPLAGVASEISRCIDAEDHIADDASPDLKRVRRDIRITEDNIHVRLGKMLNQTYASYLQDSIITMRDDRYCLPVKSEYKSQVKGIVHDQSSSGSTLFIEPAAIVEMGNTVRELESREKREEEKVLEALTTLLSDHLTALRDDAKNMTALDVIFAKARLAMNQNAVRPVFNDRHILRLRRARHPLIDPKRVVPIDLTIGEDFDMIIITGPNTGGKTVTLKTVGLLTLMGMAGLHIPAGEGSELSIFREVYADIGDEQSIEQNLSTFSSHMTSIVDILRRADKRCLCLFDELGSGTDPTEGAALAISILNFMHTRKITTLATTHYAELKLYAMRTDGIVNASCEFDVETLQPTYRLLVGVPGKSNAFAISQKLGLPGYIIETAKEQLSQETKNYEEVLTQLDEARQRAQKEREEADRRAAELDRREAALAAKEAGIEEKRRRVLDQANEKARNILQDAKEQADSAIAQVRKSGQSADVAAMEQTRTALREKVAAKDRKLSHPQKAEKPPEARPLTAAQVRVGQRVLVRSMDMEGTVTKLPDRQGRVAVQIGIMNSLLPLSDLLQVPDAPRSAGPSPRGRSDDAARGHSGSSAGGSGKGTGSLRGAMDSLSSSKSDVDLSRAMTISSELNLIGMTVDEAIPELDKYLDEARMSHLTSVRIVHGKGTGALRNAVHNYLRRQKWVRSFRAGAYGEGDAGVTIVEL